MKLKLHTISCVLLLIGGLNWGLVALGTGLGDWLPAGILRIVYFAVGLSAVYEIAIHKKTCKECEDRGMQDKMGM